MGLKCQRHEESVHLESKKRKTFHHFNKLKNKSMREEKKCVLLVG